MEYPPIDDELRVGLTDLLGRKKVHHPAEHWASHFRAGPQAEEDHPDDQIGNCRCSAGGDRLVKRGWLAQLRILGEEQCLPPDWEPATPGSGRCWNSVRRTGSDPDRILQRLPARLTQSQSACVSGRI